MLEHRQGLREFVIDYLQSKVRRTQLRCLGRSLGFNAIQIQCRNRALLLHRKGTVTLDRREIRRNFQCRL